MHVVLLGTGGGPRPSTHRFPSSQAVVLGDRLVVVDCGNGVAAQLVAAGLDPRNLTDLLVTHHHIDHSADLAVLPMVSWINGRTEPIRVAGPPPTTVAFDSLLNGFAEDLRCRTASTGRPDFRSLVTVTDLKEGGKFFDDGQLTFSCALVNHPPFEYALAYRIDSPDGSVVISGDTTPSPELIRLAQGADVLIHEVVHPVAIGQSQRGTNATRIGDHLRNNHTMIDDVGGVAAAAGVGTLVLSHLVPHHGVSDEDWIEPVRKDFDGEVIVGRDLLSLEIVRSTVDIRSR